MKPLTVDEWSKAVKFWSVMSVWAFWEHALGKSMARDSFYRAAEENRIHAKEMLRDALMRAAR